MTAPAPVPHRVAYPLTELAAMLGKKPRTLRELHRTGKLPAKRLGRDLMVPADWVAQYGPLPSGGES